jgi:RimJ/RimL family protein N-acetyltransferase
MLSKTAAAGNDGGVMVRLEPMDEATYVAWREATTREYAAEKVKAGNYPQSGAYALADAEFERLLPNGRLTQGHEIRSMVNDDGEKVGHAWFTIENRDAGRVVFIYDIAVEDAHRRKGYARQALEEIDRYARENGCIGVMLHVFGDNEAARRLYSSAGYLETNVMMLKRVIPNEERRAH